MPKYFKRNYRRKSFRRPKKFISKKKYISYRNKKKQKNYESHKIAVKKIDEVVVPQGNVDTIFNVHVPWYFEEYKGIDRQLEGIVDQDIFRSATKNYERYRPIGVKLSFTPSYGATQSQIDYHWMVSDGNTNLKSIPVSLAEGMQHKYYRQLKPGVKWKHYINLKKHAKGLGLGWVATSTPILANVVPERMYIGVQARPWAYTQVTWNRDSVQATAALPTSFGVLKRTYYFEFVDRKNFE